MKKKYELTQSQMGVLFEFDDNGNPELTSKKLYLGASKNKSSDRF